MSLCRARSVVARSLPRPSSTRSAPFLLSHVKPRSPAQFQLVRRSASATAGSSGPEVSPTPPKLSLWRRFLQTLGTITLVTVVASGGAFYYYAKREQHPGEQLDFDPEKKTLVILGSGWGATSLLKTLDTEDYNVILISPRNYFLFTPLLPSVAVGTVTPRSIIQPTRYVARHKKRKVSVIEAEATDVDPLKKTVTFSDTSDIQGQVWSTTIPYDYLVYAVGAETQTFNIPGVAEHACFMKELHDAEKFQTRFMDCVESAAFPGQSPEEIDRLLHMVVVGGGPTGVELSGELHDFLTDDLKQWYPELAERIRITLVEALPTVLPSFSKQLIEYTESTFKEAKIDVLTKTMVKEIKEKSVVVKMPDGSTKEMPMGLIVWAGGNKMRKLTADLIAKLPETQTNRRGLTVDDHLRLKGAESIFALGDCTATQYAPTAQVATQEGAYLARLFNSIARKDALEKQLKALQADPIKAEEQKTEVENLQKQLMKLEKLRPFHYSHQGSLAYIGSEKAIADLPIFGSGNLATGGVATYLFWRSAYLSTLFSFRNRALVALDWMKVKFFGRDVSRE
ncbi:FAD/NAD P-binding domain-containing protein [Gloeophyllum trabeum ATCC 11539]|uniref:NADH:ubiquinone reductase (non-electrogenic) n=1 Tax=Gloeophyllum trabeum (strain ATCC 11539 / FP-39264 / Madison 617) TaxID=670483 RepID=S7PVK5_GLOTA|nr:FAD/NAD P-binding domain-containing protein [Gloeophyllum trabeum ATCC 11539]EPQ51528.1 FAD/NAD P-binding domain-containing protein [Gloeophyllum trabeum ATCC 11539]